MNSLSANMDWVKRNLKRPLMPLKLKLYESTILRKHPSFEDGDANSLSKITSAEVRQSDGEFFEKFGSALRDRASQASEHIECVRVPSVAAVCGQEEQVHEAAAEDSEEEHIIEEDEIFSDVIGSNVEQLYAEVLYETVHGLGLGATENQDEVLEFLKTAFKFDEEKHGLLLEEARAKEAPDILLNVEVIEAQELRAKDCNGLSDPFCTLYISNQPTQRYNTSVKSQTLKPTWEEHFSLPVDDPNNDVLVIEVWDFDPAETVREKLGKISDVKGVKGLKKLIKEVAITASTGKHDNELVGIVEIPLKEIHASGMKAWRYLNKKGKSKHQGQVHVGLSLGALKNVQVATQEHRQLLKILLKHDIEVTKPLPYKWSGQFLDLAASILNQHRVHTGIDENHVQLARWAEFCSHHTEHALNFQLLGRTLEKLCRPIRDGALNDEEAKVFWEAAKKLMPACLTCIRKLRRLMPEDKATLTQLEALLSVLSQLTTLTPPAGFELFPSTLYAWLSPSDGPNCDIRKSIQDAVRQGAKEWYGHIVETNNDEDKKSDDQDIQLSYYIKILTCLYSDILRAIEHHDKIYSDVVQFEYSRTVYEIYDDRVYELVQPVVQDTCMSLKPLKFNEDPAQGIYDNDSITMGTSLFELYIGLQRFVVLGQGLYPNKEFKCTKFHTWFHKGVAQWLDIALYKALKRIEKAVELGNLQPLDSNVKFSSSAVDTLSIYYQIKVFWKQLNWPDVESSYTFVTKIIDDICRCSVFYADKMSHRVSGLGESENAFSKKFEVTTEWCTAINNIEYIRQAIQPFVLELGLEKILDSMAEFHSEAEANQCRKTLQLVIDNTVDTVSNKIVELIEIMAEKMSPSLHKFLVEGAELLHQNSMSLDRLIDYLEKNFSTLHSQLSEENFKRTLAVVWDNLTKQLQEQIDNSIEKRRPPSFFANLSEALTILEGFFKYDETEIASLCENSDLLATTKARLKMHSLETSDLIHCYHVNRYEEQKLLTHTPSQNSEQCCGLLTIKCMFQDQFLKIEILNGRNLRPTDSNGYCDSYVKVHLLPEEKFAGIVKPKTKVHKKNLFPLYDETFSVPMSEHAQRTEDALIHFVVKDYEMLSSNELVGEAFFPFSEVRFDSDFQNVAQFHLPLTRPSAALENEAFIALDHRQGDKMAKDFVKKERARDSR
ncbi:protein unc-13 homolog 4B isoform X2 [Neocloeon triangulifer]|uniref:protein unc-13 homolog 4B isoform X2 n=1 Tax=Neocloeon triangulifer TaxID=2078957 RepID=UPI00286EDB47|nr:protein unc-13 homolog 4B isoform X2 [Neocloeon triangulifer]